MDRLRLTFLYALGDRVRWDDGDAPEEAVYTIVWRQWHQGQVSTFVQYGLTLDPEDGLVVAVAYEPDLLPLEEDTP